MHLLNDSRVYAVSSCLQQVSDLAWIISSTVANIRFADTKVD